MAEYQTIKFQMTPNGVAFIELARPRKHNAMNGEMIAELTRALVELHSDKSLRTCVLQAQGEIFCAGGDLGLMQFNMRLGREEKIAQADKITKLLRALDELPCPLIGKIQGSAFGGGIGLMAVCDVVIANSSAKFALTETRLGLIPATIAPFVLRRIGESWARQYFFSAKPFDAQLALTMNLVSAVAPASELDQMVENEIEQCLKCLPGAVSAAKTLVRELARNPSLNSDDITASRLADRWESDEAKDAIAAFFASREQ